MLRTDPSPRPSRHPPSDRSPPLKNAQHSQSFTPLTAASQPVCGEYTPTPAAAARKSHARAVRVGPHRKHGADTQQLLGMCPKVKRSPENDERTASQH